MIALSMDYVEAKDNFVQTAPSVQSVWVYDPWCVTPWYTASLVKALNVHIARLRLVCPRYHLEPDYFLSCGLSTDPGPIDKVSGWTIRNTSLRRVLRIAEWSINTSALAYQLRRTPPEILHVQQCPLLSHGFSMELDFLHWVQRYGTSVVHTVHNLLPHSEMHYNRDLHRRLYKQCDALICHSEDVSLRLQKEFDIPADKITTIPHGPLFVSRSQMSQHECRDALGLPSYCQSEVIFLWQGVLAPYKGVDLLLHAWRLFEQHMQRKHRKVRLLIAGTGPESEIRRIRTIVGHINSSKNVRLDIGYIPAARIPLYYQAADVIVYPYREITTSGALMTGLNYQKPIIATDLPAFRTVLENERNALLVPGPSVQGLAEAMLRLATSQQLLDVLRFHAQSNPERQTQWNEIAVKTMDVYRKAIQ